MCAADGGSAAGAEGDREQTRVGKRAARHTAGHGTAGNLDLASLGLQCLGLDGRPVTHQLDKEVVQVASGCLADKIDGKDARFYLLDQAILGGVYTLSTPGTPSHPSGSLIHQNLLSILLN